MGADPREVGAGAIEPANNTDEVLPDVRWSNQVQNAIFVYVSADEMLPDMANMIHIPEPATLGFVAVGAIALLRRRAACIWSNRDK